MPAPTCPTQLGRGVFRAPCFAPNGEIILFAVDHRGHYLGDAVGRLLVATEAEVDRAVGVLWRVLDEVDREHARRQQPRPLEAAS